MRSGTALLVAAVAAFSCVGSDPPLSPPDTGDAGVRDSKLDVGVSGSTLLVAGGRASVGVRITRTEIQGEVVVAVTGLPSGITASALTLVAGIDEGTLELTAAETATVGPADALVTAVAGTLSTSVKLPLDVRGRPGTPDSRFGPGGKAVVDFGGDNPTFSCDRTPDGKIVVFSMSAIELALARLEPDGKPDATFGQMGKVTTTTAAGLLGRGAVYPDGRMLYAAGSTYDGAGEFHGTRFTASGVRDAVFNPNGSRSWDLDVGDVPSAVLVDTTGGGAFIGGDVGYSTTHLKMGFVRPIDTGTLDGTFNGNGSLIHEVAATNARVRGMARQKDGQVVAVGSIGNAVGGVRLPLVGNSIKPTVIDVIQITTGTDRANAVAIAPDDKIVLVGVGAIGALAEQNSIAVRLLSDLSIDSSFGGMKGVALDLGVSEELLGVAVQEDLKVIAVGTIAALDVVIIRLTPQGQLDPTFGSGGKIVTRFDAASASATGILLDATGIVVCGSTGTMPSRDVVVARYWR